MRRLSQAPTDSQAFAINNPRPYRPIEPFTENIVDTCGRFALQMTFEQLGQHKKVRSGGSHIRELLEIFENTFQGKLAEFAAVNLLRPALPSQNLAPGLDVAPLGYWEDTDIFGPNYSIEVKSTKHFGNLLLLERANWNRDGTYRHTHTNGSSPISHVVMVRIKPNVHELLSGNKNLLVESPDRDTKIVSLLRSEKWTYDCPGYASSEDLRTLFRDGFLIKRGSRLGEKAIQIDADNYYLQTGDLRPIPTLISELSRTPVAANEANRDKAVVGSSIDNQSEATAHQQNRVDVDKNEKIPQLPDSQASPVQVGPAEQKFGRIQTRRKCLFCNHPSEKDVGNCVCGHKITCEVDCPASNSGTHEDARFSHPSAPVEASSETRQAIQEDPENRKNANWEREEDELLVQHYLSGASRDEIARRLNRTAGGVTGRLKRLFLELNGFVPENEGVSVRKLNPTQSARAILLYDRGSPIEKIALEIGTNSYQIAKSLMDARLLDSVNLDEVTYFKSDSSESRPLRSGERWASQEDSELQRNWLAGQNLSELAENHQRTESAIFMRLCRLEIISVAQLSAFVEALREEDQAS